MDRTHLLAFLDELEKIGEQTPKEFEKKLRPGDILVGRLRHPGIAGTVIGQTLSAFQGGAEYYHAALYTGKNKVVDINTETGVRKKTFDDFADRYRLKALRVKTTGAIKDRAVAFAEKQVGKGYNLLGALRQALPARSDEGERRRQKAVDSFFCSQLVSNAYDKVPLGRDRFVGDVRPVDLQKSPLTKTVGTLP